MRVAVAVVGFRNAGDVERCLTAVARSTHTDFEVVICENGGSEAFQALVATTPERLPRGQAVRLIQAPGNLGFAGGVNVCIAAAPNADAVWVLNPDTEAESGALAALTARLETGDCDAAGGVLVRSDGSIQGYGGRYRAWLGRAVAIGMGSALGDPVDRAAIERAQNFILGASLLAGRRFLTVTGPMREDYFLYGEEVEWCLRGLDRGMRLGFAPDSIVRHYQGGATGSGLGVRRRPKLPVYLDERNKLLLTRDLYPTRLPLAALSTLLLLFLRYGVKGRGGALGHALAGWWSGLRNQRGVPSFLTT